MTSTFKFEWKVHDGQTVEQMKNAAFTKEFRSSVFSAFGLRWYMQAHPNGHSSREEGYFDLYLYLPYFPVKLKAFEIAQTLQCLETDTKHERTATFDTSEGTGWSGQILALKDIQSCETLTFVLTMELIAVYDVRGEDVTDVYLQKHEAVADRNGAAPATLDFPWKIDAQVLQQMQTAVYEQKFRSPIFSAFGLRWSLGIYPKGQKIAGDANLYLQLLSLPPKLKSVHIAFILQCLETDTQHHSDHEYERAYGVGWPDGKLSTAQIETCTELTFNAKLELIVVVDKDGDDITEWHLKGESKPKQDKEEETKQQAPADDDDDDDDDEDGSAKLRALLRKLQGLGSDDEDNKPSSRPAAGKSGGRGGQNDPLMAARLHSLSMDVERMTQKMVAIESRLAEKAKQKDKGRATQAQFEAVQKQVIAMERTMRQLMMKDMDPEELKFKAWLDSIDGLAAYYDLMVARGVINFDKLSVLSMQDIQNMGIDNIHHVMVILNKVLDLNRNTGGKSEGNLTQGGNTPQHM